MSPFQALNGRPPPAVVRLRHNSTSIDNLEQLLRERDAHLDELSTQLLVAHNRMPYVKFLRLVTSSTSNSNHTINGHLLGALVINYPLGSMALLKSWLVLVQ